MGDEDSHVRALAAWALGEIGDKSAVESLIEVLKDKDNDVCSDAKIALVEIGKPAVKLLISVLRDKDEDIRIRFYAATLLGEIGDKAAIKSLIETLKDTDARVCWHAAEALGKIGDQSAVKPLIEALKDKERYVRTEAVKALIKITNQDFGQDYEQWMEWYNKNK